MTMGVRLFLLLSCVATVFSEDRIVNGNIVTQFSDAPHAAILLTPVSATIFNFLDAQCGASILAIPNAAASRWAITAAHCVAGVGPGFLNLRYGCLNRNDAACQTVTVDQYYIHPYYVAATATSEAQYDVALLRFNADLPGTYTGIQLVSTAIPAENPLPSTQARLYGWGATQFNAATISDVLRVATGTVVNDAVACCTFFETSTANIALTSNVPYSGPCIGDDGSGLVSSFAQVPSPVNNRLVGVLSGYQGCGTTPASVSTYANLFHPQIRQYITAQIAAPAAQLTAGGAGLAAAAPLVPCPAPTLGACRLPTPNAIVGLTEGTAGFGGGATCFSAPFIQTGTNFVSFAGAEDLQLPDAPNNVQNECNAVDVTNAATDVQTPAIYGRYFRIAVPPTATRIIVDACEIGVDPTLPFVGPGGVRVGTLPQDVTVALYDGTTVFSGFCSVDQTPLTCTSGNIPERTCGGSGRGATLVYEFAAGSHTEFLIRLASNANDFTAEGNFVVSFFDTTIPPALPNLLQTNLGGCGILGGNCNLELGEVCKVDTCTVGLFRPSTLSILTCFLLVGPNFPTHTFECNIFVRDGFGNPISGDLSIYTIAALGGEVEIVTPNDPLPQYTFRVSNNEAPGTEIRVLIGGVNIVGSPFIASPYANINPCDQVLVAGASCTPGSAAPGGVGDICDCQGATSCQLGFCVDTNILTCPNPNDPLPPALATTAGIVIIDPTCANAGNLVFGPLATSIIGGGIPGAQIQFASITLLAGSYLTLPDPAAVQSLTFSGPNSALYGCHTTFVNVDLSVAVFPTIAHYGDCPALTARFYFNGQINNLPPFPGNTFLLRGPVTFSATSTIGTQALPFSEVISITHEEGQIPPQTSFLDGQAYGTVNGLLLVNHGALVLGDNNLPRNLPIMMALGNNAVARECLTVCGNSGHFEIKQGCWGIRLDCVNPPAFTSSLGISIVRPRVPIVINAFGALNQPASVPQFSGTLALPAPTEMRFVINAVNPTGLAVNQEFILARADLIAPKPLTEFSVPLTINAPSTIVTAVVSIRDAAVSPSGLDELVLKITSIAAAPSTAPATPSPSPPPATVVYNQNLADIPRDSSAFATAPMSVLLLLVSLMAAYLMF